MGRTSGFSIGLLARITDCKIQTIRYYEQIGLLPVPTRSSGGQRRYTSVQQRRLSFIRHARALGFPLPAIRSLLRLADCEEESCAEADRIASTQLHAIASRIALLESLREELERMLSECQGGHVGECRVIETIANHALCVHENHTVLRSWE